MSFRIAAASTRKWFSAALWLKQSQDWPLRSQVAATTKPVISATSTASPLVIVSISAIQRMDSAIMDSVADSSEKPQLDHLSSGALVIGLGANLGDARQTLARAVFRLRELFQVRRVSPLYRSEPIGPEQPDFFNAALLVDESRGLHEVLSILQMVEREYFRVRAERWGPRTLDLDILWSESQISSSSSLTVPHRELRQRAFALQPLLDVFPSAKDPVDGSDYRAILSTLKGQRMERIAQGEWTEALSGGEALKPSGHPLF